jgi:hypothetical protein
MDRQQLINFISKRIDREISRPRSSGFTLWALSGIILYLLYDLTNNFFLIISAPEISNLFLPISAGIINLCFFLMLFTAGILFISLSKSEGEVREAKSSISQSTWLLVTFPANVSYILFSAINYFAATDAYQYNLSFLLFMLFALFFILNPANMVYEKATHAIYKWQKKYTLLKLNEVKIYTYQLYFKIAGTVFLLIALIGLSANFLNFKNTTITALASSDDIKLLLISSFEIFAINLFLAVLAYIFRDRTLFFEMEKLEKDIYLNDISESEIMERLDKILGIPIVRWIKSKISLLKAMCNQQTKVLSDCECKLDDVMQTTEKNDEIVKSTLKETNRTIRIYNTKAKDANYIIGKLWKLVEHPSISGDELSEVKSIIQVIQGDYKVMKEKVRAVLKKRNILKSQPHN